MDAPDLPLFDLPPSFRSRTGGPGEVERWAHGRGLRLLVGADEVGRGPLAGPVVAAAVALPPEHGINGLDDSKRLGEGRRRELARAIRARALATALVELPAQEIDRTNVLRAALVTMAAAVRRVCADVGGPDLVLVDGNQPLPAPFPQKTLVGGDRRSENVAAASILAKVYRDAVMERHHLCWPAYAFDRNKGYGTQVHRDALCRHGPCPIHRLTFRGVNVSASVAILSPMGLTECEKGEGGQDAQSRGREKRGTDRAPIPLAPRVSTRRAELPLSRG